MPSTSVSICENDRGRALVKSYSPRVTEYSTNYGLTDTAPYMEAEPAQICTLPVARLISRYESLVSTVHVSPLVKRAPPAMACQWRVLVACDKADVFDNRPSRIG